MTDTTITPEERAKMRKCIHLLPEPGAEVSLRLIAALETAEARAEEAEAENSALKEDLDETEKSLKEYAGFFEQLCDGLKKRFPVQYTTLEGDEYGDDAFSAHDLLDHVIDPVIHGAKEAEAENARMRAANLYLAEHLHRAGVPCPDDGAYFDPDGACREKIASGLCSQCFAEAARRAVAGEGEKNARTETVAVPCVRRNRYPAA